MKRVVSWILRIATAIILAQSVIHKFVGNEMSVAVFTTIGMEPEGRYLIGAIELLAVFMLLLPNSVAAGALLGWGVMTGAIIGHLTTIGIKGDMMTGFMLSVGIWVAAIVLMVIHRTQVPILKHMFEK